MSATKDFSHSSKRSKRLIRALRGFFLQFFNPRRPKNPVLTLKRRGPTGAGESSLAPHWLTWGGSAWKAAPRHTTHFAQLGLRPVADTVTRAGVPAAGSGPLWWAVFLLRGCAISLACLGRAHRGPGSCLGGNWREAGSGAAAFSAEVGLRLPQPQRALVHGLGPDTRCRRTKTLQKYVFVHVKIAITGPFCAL